jgi:site-specific DNA-methyltransferase (adenine-specific)
MEIEERQLTSITLYQKNAKVHPDKQVKQIANSIKEFGFSQPIVVDKAGVIIVGHGRYLAAHLLGLETVPVLTVNLDEEQAKAYRLADNKLNESDWDMELVIAELKELSIPMVELTGFNKNLVLQDDKEDLVPAEPKIPRTKLGDVYQLGSHRIVCGDATKPETYEILMDGQKADMVFTDPPYNVNYKGRGKDTSTTILNDKMGDSDFKKFLGDTFKNVRANIKGGGGALCLPLNLNASSI